MSELVTKRLETIKRTFTATKDGAPLDLTGLKVVFTAQTSHEAHLLQKTSDAGEGIEITDAEGGEFEIEFTKADYANVPAGDTHQYTIWIVDNDGKTVAGPAHSRWRVQATVPVQE